MRKEYLFLIAFLFTVSVAGSAMSQCCAAGGKPSGENAEPGKSGCQSGNAISEQLSAVLDRVEQAGVKLKSFQADMLFQQEQILVETLTNRRGTLHYRVDTDSVRARIGFRNFQQQNLDDEKPARIVKFDEDYVFDGMWVTRRNARTKSIQKWELSRKPRDKETFRLGRGPFPLPFAIKKKDVIEHFETKLLKPDPNDPAETEHLKLLPKKDSPYAEEYVQMDLWISKNNALPVRISYEKDDYEITTVNWTDIEIDKTIKDKVFKLKPGGRGWSEEIHPLEEKEENADKTTR